MNRDRYYIYYIYTNKEEKVNIKSYFNVYFFLSYSMSFSPKNNSLNTFQNNED